jgi:hypothetical protein
MKKLPPTNMPRESLAGLSRTEEISMACSTAGM